MVSSFFLSFFPCLISAVEDLCLPYFHTWCGLSTTLGCRSETCCTQLAENTGCKNRQKFAICDSAHHHTTLSSYIFATKASIDNRKKKLLNSKVSPTCPYNMVNFGLLAAEIVLLVLGTPGNFNGFRVLAALLHGTLVAGVSQTLRH